MIHGLETAAVSQPSHPALEHQTLEAAESQGGQGSPATSPWHSSSPSATWTGRRRLQAHANYLQSGKSAANSWFCLLWPRGYMKHLKYSAAEQSSSHQGRL